jgi:phosphate acetyltransferase
MTGDFGFGAMIDKLKKSPKTIVFTEGCDPRILEASSRLLASSFLKPILIGFPDDIYSAAEEAGFNIRGAKIIDPNNFDDIDYNYPSTEFTTIVNIFQEQISNSLNNKNSDNNINLKMFIRA